MALVVVGCTRSIEDPQARPAAPVGPVSPLQVGDLLSPDVVTKDGNLFAEVEPARCAGVAREVDPPFIVEAPGHYQDERLTALGNAVVPQCAYVIGRIVVEHHHKIARSVA